MTRERITAALHVVSALVRSMHVPKKGASRWAAESPRYRGPLLGALYGLAIGVVFELLQLMQFEPEVCVYGWTKVRARARSSASCLLAVP